MFDARLEVTPGKTKLPERFRGSALSYPHRGALARWAHLAQQLLARPQGADCLGRPAFDAVVQAESGVAPRTALTQAILDHLRVDTVEAALHLCTARARSHPLMKPLAKVLFDVAAQGDDVAMRLVVAHGGH